MPDNNRHTSALTVLTVLFFMWGLITSLNDILVPHLKAVFTLNYVQASLIQFSFFAAYFVMSFPSGRLVERLGYKSGIILGLLTAGVGCLLFVPAASAQSYVFFLAALFILASGITLLQVAANPYVNILGSPESAASRLNMTQAFNSLGTTVGPLVGSVTILAIGAGAAGGVEQQTERVLENLKAVLEACGSSLDKVVKTTVFLRDMEDFPRMNEVYARYFPASAPARSTVQAARLPRDVNVEIDVIALAG